MRTFSLGSAVAFCLFAMFFGAAGCAPGTFETVAPPAGAAAGTWTFRHAVTLALPQSGITLPFTGVMRFNASAGEAHAVLLSGMGMTLLDITVTGESHTVRFMHPSFTRLPHADRNAAAVIRHLWFGKVAAETGGQTVSSGGVSDGWAGEMILFGKGFTARLKLLESRREI